MATAHKLDRLTKWASRPEWSEAMEDMLDSHVFLVTSLYDLDLDQLADIIGETAVMNLWACAFEDLLSRDFDGRNVTDDYLKRRGWKESASNRAYIKALRAARISLYEASGIKRGQGFFARDLLRGGEPVWVNEGLRTHDLAEGGIGWLRASSRSTDARSSAWRPCGSRLWRAKRSSRLSRN
ncbi:hypothetical protein Q1M63_31390 [Sinorhizobium meliloti]|nr:hypothetical protein Q1M63_31390 [Sinorhizobium meliloti]